MADVILKPRPQVMPGSHVIFLGGLNKAGAWVENPTMFSNEYAADMVGHATHASVGAQVGDKWIAVTHDTA